MVTLFSHIGFGRVAAGGVMPSALCHAPLPRPDGPAAFAPKARPARAGAQGAAVGSVASCFSLFFLFMFL